MTLHERILALSARIEPLIGHDAECAALTGAACACGADGILQEVESIASDLRWHVAVAVGHVRQSGDHGADAAHHRQAAIAEAKRLYDGAA